MKEPSSTFVIFGSVDNSIPNRYGFGLPERKD
jgi:hypothetical protein